MISRGSEWHRWEPHIHAPGTVINNQFTGPTAWADYLSALKAATPPIEAIAVTDYYGTETYEKVVECKRAGRLPSARLIFPNVELRLDVATAKGGFVNLHLLVSPEDANHIEQLQRLLSRLHFTVQQDRFDCTRADLIRLGKKANTAITDDHVALAYGANQYKVNFTQLREVLNMSEWAQSNILVAVAGSANDGTSGVREAADQTLRREIESFADVIFASSQAQREFWLGERVLNPEQIRARYGGLKPCLHGSDAHKLDDVATPFGDRFSWIKGGLDFDSLRQACIDPRGRAYVGAEPPTSATPSQVISEVEAFETPWLQTPVVPLNAGLVAIIGARGSGKTALADMIAAGCDSISEEAWAGDEAANPSFLVRARSLLADGNVKITWGGGDPSIRSLDGSDANDPRSYARVRYLSQRFVEDLCSSSGLTDELLGEIERVIFEAHPEHDRDGTLDFAELLEHRASRYRFARQLEAEAVSDISGRISIELEKQNLVASFEAQVAQKKKLVDAYTADRAKLVSAGSEQRAQRHTEIAGAANKVRAKLRQFTTQRQTFFALHDEVEDLRRNKAPEALRQMQARHSNSGMSDNQWTAFLLDYTGKVDDDLAGYIEWVGGEIARLKGTPPPSGDPNTPLFPDDTDLSAMSQACGSIENVSVLACRRRRLQPLRRPISASTTTRGPGAPTPVRCRMSNPRLTPPDLDGSRFVGMPAQMARRILPASVGVMLARLPARVFHAAGTIHRPLGTTSGRLPGVQEVGRRRARGNSGAWERACRGAQRDVIFGDVRRDLSVRLGARRRSSATSNARALVRRWHAPGGRSPRAVAIWSRKIRSHWLKTRLLVTIIERRLVALGEQRRTAPRLRRGSAARSPQIVEQDRSLDPKRSSLRRARGRSRSRGSRRAAPRDRDRGPGRRPGRTARSEGRPASTSACPTADSAWLLPTPRALIDLRKQGAFRGKGTLLQTANEMLKSEWETGTSADVVAAMTRFRQRYQKHLLDHSPMAHSEQAKFRAWSKLFAEWLFSTDHIGIQYGIEYDGVDIRRLSPGTRGIVLLLLYLALDDADGRPLVIDQPEENLDPKSVFEELVGLFVEAKSNRQVIIVTHNANLVVNTDADQVIIAEAGPHPHGSLPPISYKSGGLENTEIRKAVCNILEGGERAFQERARRLRVRGWRAKEQGWRASAPS